MKSESRRPLRGLSDQPIETLRRVEQILLSALERRTNEEKNIGRVVAGRGCLFVVLDLGQVPCAVGSASPVGVAFAVLTPPATDKPAPDQGPSGATLGYKHGRSNSLTHAQGFSAVLRCKSRL